MRPFYMVDLYLNALCQLGVNQLRVVGFRVTWVRLGLLATSLYYLLISAGQSAVRGDVLSVLLTCAIVVASLVFLAANFYEACRVIVGDGDVVDEARCRVQDSFFDGTHITIRPFYCAASCLFAVLYANLPLSLQTLTVGLALLTLDTYLETCV